jgi:hypothetical protein
MRLDLLSFSLGLVVKSLEDFGVFAGVNGEHPAIQERTILLRDSLVLIF